MDIDPKLLRIFAVLLRTGSVTRTAEELNTTQPSVSKALKRLESVIGFPMLERKVRHLVPTAEGKLIGDDAKHIERELEAFRRHASEIRHGRHQGFSVATIPVFSTTLLPEAIVELRRRRPNAMVKVDVCKRSTVLSEFDAGRLDVGLIHCQSEHIPSGFEVVANAPLVCVLPQEHRLCTRDVVTPGDLSGEKMVIYHNSLDFADPVWRLIEHLDPQPDIAAEASQSALLRDLVRRGVGVSILDGFTANDPP